MSFGKAFYGPDLTEGLELLGCVCWPTTCAGKSGMEDGDGVDGKEMSEIETRDYRGCAEEDFSGVVFGKGLFDAVYMTDVMTGFPL